MRISRCSQLKDVDAAVYRLRSWSPKDIVFDVGANDGRTILRLQKYMPSPSIYAFEPVSTTYDTLVERTEHLENVRCFQLALGAEPSRQTIYLTDRASTNSFYPDWRTPVGNETVEVSSVDQIMIEHGIDFIHLLKVDTEGHDLKVLKGAINALTSSKIAIIQVEVRFDYPNLALEHFRRFLNPMGYRLSGIYTQSKILKNPPQEWSSDEVERCAFYVLRYCDAVFVCTS